MKSMGEIECNEMWVTCVPIVDQSSLVETNIFADDNVPGLLWALVIRN